jgi:hypothetical protein
MKGNGYVFDLWMQFRQKESEKSKRQKEEIASLVEIKAAFGDFPKAVVF